MLTVTRRELRLIDPSKNTRKFYTLFTSSMGHVLFHWGRIDTKGQFKSLTLDPGEVEDYARRQMYSKLSKGYVREGEDVFEAERSDFQSPTSLERAHRNYRTEHAVDSSTQKTASEIDAFAEQVNKLITATQSQDTSDLMEEYLAIKDGWKEIQARIEIAETAMEMLDMRMKGEL